jgi:cysteinyl-tRNA synthetase
MGTAKMAGSVGNVVNIKDLLERHNPETVRLLLLSTHYRSPIEYSEERLNEVAKSLQSFYRLFERYERITGKDFYSLSMEKFGELSLSGTLRNVVGDLRNRFFENMMDDFNTGGAVGILFELLTELNRFADASRLESEKPQPALSELVGAVLVLRELSQILGLFWAPPPEAKLGGDDKLVAGLMQLLIDLRNNLRAEAKKIAAKDDPTKKALFEQTDVIRKRLGELGVLLEDRPGGTTWRRA